LLAHLANQERTENQANLAPLVHLASQANRHWKFAPKYHHHHANHARQDHLAHLVHPAKLALLAHRVNPADLAKMDNPAHLARPDQTAHLVNLAKMEKKDPPALQPSLYLLLLVIPVQLAKLVHLDHLATLAHLALMVNPAQPVQKARPETLVPTATMVLLATKDHLDPMATKENRVFAPNIAPWMAVFSSKTARGDKRSSRLYCKAGFSSDRNNFGSFFYGSSFLFLLDNKNHVFLFVTFALASSSFAALIDKSMIVVAYSIISALRAVFLRFFSGSSKVDHGVSYHAMDAKLTSNVFVGKMFFLSS
jgi:hypothetical protein